MKLSINPLGQRDPRWKDQRLGTKTGTTIGSDGCVITSASMMYTYYGKPTLPNELDNFLTDNNLYTNGNLWTPAHVNKWKEGMKYDRQVNCSSVPAPIADIKAYLDAGKPVFVWLMNNGVFHCTLAVGYEGNEIIVNDPWIGDTILISQRWGKSVDQILEVDYYTGQVPAQNPQITIDTKLYEHLVNGASVRKDVATYLEMADPDNAPFDKIKAVIAGYKSAVTEAQNKANEANTKLAVANTEIKNQEEKVANVTRDCQIKYDLLSGQYETLKKMTTTVEKLREEYEGRIEALMGTLRACEKSGGQKDLTITELTSKVEVLTKNQAKTYKLGELLSLVWEKIKVLDIKL